MPTLWEVALIVGNGQRVLCQRSEGSQVHGVVYLYDVYLYE
jgi:hypothetical protein